MVVEVGGVGEKTGRVGVGWENGGRNWWENGRGKGGETRGENGGVVMTAVSLQTKDLERENISNLNWNNWMPGFWILRPDEGTKKSAGQLSLRKNLCVKINRIQLYSQAHCSIIDVLIPMYYVISHKLFKVCNSVKHSNIYTLTQLYFRVRLKTILVAMETLWCQES